MNELKWPTTIGARVKAKVMCSPVTLDNEETEFELRNNPDPSDDFCGLEWKAVHYPIVIAHEFTVTDPESFTLLEIINE